ncbi:hypothetical protein ACFPOI_11675 [Nonomuraea angiospora]|uniref:DUF4404 family protein n=1 Tax=Nonomuraea angiospora TaxID=46172 RepID=A0ABR9ME34_9ACTN|nr:hypothetical protein [Nonomuraea angiospora]MBE1591182.1 hypothetical protein [Nonomuraea angiospora]
MNAGSGIQYVGGHHQTARRDIHGVAGHQLAGQGLHADLEAIRSALDELRLSAAERQSAERELSAVEDAVGGETPDREQAGHHLQELTSGLERAGAGATLIDALGRIAQWLGPLGAGVLTLFGH